jgi:hypothetical protein
MTEQNKQPTNQTLLLQIVRDIEILKVQSLQILESSRDHENRIRELEKQTNRNAWIPSLVTALITSGVILVVTKGLGF